MRLEGKKLGEIRVSRRISMGQVNKESCSEQYSIRCSFTLRYPKCLLLAIVSDLNPEEYLEAGPLIYCEVYEVNIIIS